MLVPERQELRHMRTKSRAAEESSPSVGRSATRTAPPATSSTAIDRRRISPPEMPRTSWLPVMVSAQWERPSSLSTMSVSRLFTDTGMSALRRWRAEKSTASRTVRVGRWVSSTGT